MPVYLVQHAEKAQGPGDPGITERGRGQAARAGGWAQRTGILRVYCSPLRRSRQTAQVIADALEMHPLEDQRATERMNWDGTVPWAHFAAEWARTAEDRDYAPANGDSSRAAARRLLALVREAETVSSSAAIVTHGGVTLDLLRTLLGDQAIDRNLLATGVPPCAITTLTGITVVSVASVEHLAS